MLIVPLRGNIGRKNPPVITISLILINCFVYFAFQLGDDENYLRAINYYVESGLADIEITHYKSYLKDDPEQDDPDSNRKMDRTTTMRYYGEMRGDTRFQYRLINEEIISPDDPDYAEWKELRNNYTEQLSEVVSFEYGLRPASPKPVAYFTYMFLHGGSGHLIGNMIFLWLLGCMLEPGFGKILLSVFYVATGLLAVTVFQLIYSQSHIPLVGASGAIAGLMGGTAVIYWKKKIRIFYSLGFYFNYKRLRAIILLPIWMGNEFAQLFFGGVSNVAYVAHIGGIAGGALFGFILLKLPKLLHNQEAFKEEQVDESAMMMEKALKCVSELQLGEGRDLLEQVLEKKPDHRIALGHLFNIDKMDPDDVRFHETAGRLLTLLIRNRSTYDEAYLVYMEYSELTPAALSPELSIRMSIVLSTLGHADESGRIVSAFLKKKPGLPGLPTALLKLSNAYMDKGLSKNAEKCLQVIRKRYPNSKEAGIIGKQ